MSRFSNWSYRVLVLVLVLVRVLQLLHVQRAGGFHSQFSTSIEGETLTMQPVSAQQNYRGTGQDGSDRVLA